MKFEDLESVVYRDFNRTSPSLMDRIRLLFRPTYVSVDPAIKGNDYSAAVYYKILDGNVVITKIERLTP